MSEAASLAALQNPDILKKNLHDILKQTNYDKTLADSSELSKALQSRAQNIIENELKNPEELDKTLKEIAQKYEGLIAQNNTELNSSDQSNSNILGGVKNLKKNMNLNLIKVQNDDTNSTVKNDLRTLPPKNYLQNLEDIDGKSNTLSETLENLGPSIKNKFRKFKAKLNNSGSTVASDSENRKLNSASLEIEDITGCQDYTNENENRYEDLEITSDLNGNANSAVTGLLEPIDNDQNQHYDQNYDDINNLENLDQRLHRHADDLIKQYYFEQQHENCRSLTVSKEEDLRLQNDKDFQEWKQRVWEMAILDQDRYNYTNNNDVNLNEISNGPSDGNALNGKEQYGRSYVKIRTVNDDGDETGYHEIHDIFKSQKELQERIERGELNENGYNIIGGMNSLSILNSLGTNLATSESIQPSPKLIQRYKTNWNLRFGLMGIFVMILIIVLVMVNVSGGNNDLDAAQSQILPGTGVGPGKTANHGIFMTKSNKISVPNTSNSESVSENTTDGLRPGPGSD